MVERKIQHSLIQNIPIMLSNIESTFQQLCVASSVVKNCLTDTQYLCDVLNTLDKNYLNKVYRSDKTGPVNNIRKEVAKSLLLDDLSAPELEEIISRHKSNNPEKLKSWTNPYKILHPLVNNSYREFDPIIKEFAEHLRQRIGDVNFKICNFDGAQNHGSEHYWIAYYSKYRESQSEGVQIYFGFRDGKLSYAVYEHATKTHLVDLVDFTTLDAMYEFFDTHKNYILEDGLPQTTVDTVEVPTDMPKMTFIKAAEWILEKNDNKPMTSSEIWAEIDKLGLVETDGKTPAATLGTTMMTNSINWESISNQKCSTRSPKSIENSPFKIVSPANPYKYVLVNYMPKNVKESLIKNGFITIDMLKTIFEKNGLKFEI